MDILANLLLILFYLSAIYAALGLLATAVDGIALRLATWRRRRPAPGIWRRRRHVRPRRQVGRARKGPGRGLLAAQVKAPAADKAHPKDAVRGSWRRDRGCPAASVAGQGDQGSAPPRYCQAIPISS
jgi:hypothetical protein